jgi:hypothetical protein
MFQILKVRTKVELLDPILCVVGEICAMPRMTFYGGLIALGHYFVVVTCIKGGSMKLPFPTTEASKVKYIVNGAALW